ncbi:Ribosomal lysine N-methyltransferase 4 [Lecanora helva]
MSSGNVSGDFYARSKAFMRWMHELPGTRISSKIQLADLRHQGAGRGIVATKDINEDEELFSIPQSDVLTAQNSSLQRVKPALLERLDTWNALVLCMIHEDGQGQDSRWWPYLQVLPTEFDTLIYWSPSELAELEGSAVVDKIGKNEADAAFTKILLPLVQQNSELFGRYSKDFSSSNARAALLEVAHRMATLIMAYGFDLEAEATSSDEEEEVDGSSQSAYELNKGMVPLADLFNADGHLNNAHLLQNEDSMSMIALKRIASGQQVFNDFGQLPRSDLLRRYGYINDNYKEWDVVEVDIDVVVKATARWNELSDRLELAASWGVLQDGYDLTRPSGNEAFQFGEDMVFTITALLLDANDFGQAMKDRPDCPPPSKFKTINSVLKSIISTRQKDYRTTIAEDYDMLSDTTLQRRRRMAIEVRLGEKEILALAAEDLDMKHRHDSQDVNEQIFADHAKRRKCD